MPTLVGRLLAAVYIGLSPFTFINVQFNHLGLDLRLKLGRVQLLVYKVCGLLGESFTSYIKTSDSTPTDAYMRPELSE